MEISNRSSPMLRKCGCAKRMVGSNCLMSFFSLSRDNAVYRFHAANASAVGCPPSLFASLNEKDWG